MSRFKIILNLNFQYVLLSAQGPGLFDMVALVKSKLLIYQTSARGYFGMATIDGVLLAFGGRNGDDLALATVSDN